MDYGKYHDQAVKTILGMTERVTKMSLGQIRVSDEHFEAAQDALEAMDAAYDSADWTVVGDIFMDYIVENEVYEVKQ
jgi:hypothetical protein